MQKKISGHWLRPGHPDDEHDPHGRARLRLLHPDRIRAPRLRRAR